jgi:hypothetical protein
MTVSIGVYDRETRWDPENWSESSVSVCVSSMTPSLPNNPDFDPHPPAREIYTGHPGLGSMRHPSPSHSPFPTLTHVFRHTRIHDVMPGCHFVTYSPSHTRANRARNKRGEWWSWCQELVRGDQGGWVAWCHGVRPGMIPSRRGQMSRGGPDGYYDRSLIIIDDRMACGSGCGVDCACTSWCPWCMMNTQRIISCDTHVTIGSNKHGSWDAHRNVTIFCKWLYCEGKIRGKGLGEGG